MYTLIRGCCSLLCALPCPGLGGGGALGLNFDFDFDFGHILLVSSCVNSFSIQISVTFCWFPAALGLKMILIITIKMIMIFNNNTIVNNNNSNNSNTNNSISSNSGKGGLEHGKVRARHVT